MNERAMPTRLRTLACAAIIALPLILLFDGSAAFYDDWAHHLWFTGFFGEHLRQHGTMPAVLNTAATVGLPQPVFYGFLLFPSLGVISSVLGASLALRLGFFTVIACQFYAVMAAGANTWRDRRVSFVMAASVVWSTYALTNLYNRAALPEFFAAGFLTSAVAFGVAAAFGSNATDQRLFSWLAGFCALLAIGGHPPTAVIGLPLLVITAVLVVIGWSSQPGRASWQTWLCAVAIVGATGVVLSPWIHATAQVHDSLQIMSGYRFLYYYPERSDSWLGRLSPIPYDAQSWQHGTAGVETPYLEAPVNVVGLLLLTWNLALWLRLRRAEGATPARTLWQMRLVAMMTAVAIGMFVFLTALSVSWDLGMLMPFSAARYVQFAYRLVTGCNLSLLIAVLGSGWLAAQHGAFARYTRQTSLLVSVCFAALLLATGIKLRHGQAVSHSETSARFARQGDRAGLIEAGWPKIPHDYAAMKHFPVAHHVEAAPTVTFPVGTAGRDFGVAQSTTINAPRDGWFATNVLAFPWNRVLVDGNELPPADLRRREGLLVIHLAAGRHTLDYTWRADPVWQRLRTISFWTFGLLTAATALALAARLRSALRPRAA